MGKARVCAIAPTPAKAIYDALVDWGNWGAWLERMTGFALEAGAPGAPGAVRVGQSGDRPPVRERLTACDPENLTFTYRIDGEAPFPAREYQATVRLLPLSDGSGTVVEWVSTFAAADAGTDEKVRQAMEHYYGEFIDALGRLPAAT